MIDEDEKSLAELCAPLSARVTRSGYSISGRPLKHSLLRVSEDKKLAADIARRDRARRYEKEKGDRE